MGIGGSSNGPAYQTREYKDLSRSEKLIYNSRSTDDFDRNILLTLNAVGCNIYFNLNAREKTAFKDLNENNKIYFLTMSDGLRTRYVELEDEGEKAFLLRNYYLDIDTFNRMFVSYRMDVQYRKTSAVLDENKAALEETTNRIKKTGEENTRAYEAFMRRFNGIEDDVNELKNDVNTLQTDMTNVQNNVNDVQTQTTNLERNLNRVKNTTDKNTEEINNIKTRRRQKRKRVYEKFSSGEVPLRDEEGERVVEFNKLDIIGDTSPGNRDRTFGDSVKAFFISVYDLFCNIFSDLADWFRRTFSRQTEALATPSQITPNTLDQNEPEMNEEAIGKPVVENQPEIKIENHLP